MSHRLERVKFTVPMKAYVWQPPPGVYLVLVTGCGGGSAGFCPSGLLASGGGGGGAGEMGLRVPMAVDPETIYDIVVGWGGSKSDLTYDSTGAGIGGDTFITPNGPKFAGGHSADNSNGRGGAGGGPGGAFYNGNQFNATGLPTRDDPQDSALLGFVLGSPRHFGGPCGAGTSNIAYPSLNPSGGDNVGFNVGGIGGPTTSLLRNGAAQFGGAGGAASYFAPGGRGSDAYSSDPFNNVGYGGGGGGAGSAFGKDPSEIRSGNGGPGFLMLEWPRVQ
jgi:integrin beta 8/collagen type VII alpha